MTSEQAIQTLDQVCAQTTATRQDHQVMVQALQIVRDMCEGHQRIVELEKEIVEE